MLKEFEVELLKLLEDFNIRAYLGEFENTQNIATCINGLEASLLLDFEGESYKDLENKIGTWKLYILTHTKSKTSKHRIDAKHKLFDTIESVDKVLLNAELNNGFRVELKDLKKIYEGVSDHGYLSIYARTLQSCFLPKNDFLRI
ncbi:hypothetical protein CSUB8523_0997 [Campylobacter subantarcticus LMG 24377]|uniref:Uncharacterized protein n=2 Tax=Campylobacter TaxID=194 RepID=A0A5C7E066_9BACT|nr:MULTISPECIES: hypothetical protein [Campylobacter]EAL3939488.1 hypothetical protein [Campylobacter lari]AJC92510.1 hypothetical protein CSUB8523_0997 [Campylobacter subantarcticus LMG 24377]EGK8127700.1 hypothetical protein [Campylobacter lari]MBF7060534.1 hypothetical protein [Campylobacter volucris]MPC00011.1 hypothetical protein [Campylobacter subantarcticus]